VAKYKKYLISADLNIFNLKDEVDKIVNQVVLAEKAKL